MKIYFFKKKNFKNKLNSQLCTSTFDAVYLLSTCIPAVSCYMYCCTTFKEGAQHSLNSKLPWYLFSLSRSLFVFKPVLCIKKERHTPTKIQSFHNHNKTHSLRQHDSLLHC